MSRRHLGIFTAAVLAAASLTACGGSGDDSAASPKTLTYWASNQGASLEADKKILQPELDKFEKQTGIKVKLEVVAWSDLLNRILAATTSGQGPDVLNIGNTWSASLQATGALLPFDDASTSGRSAARTGSCGSALALDRRRGQAAGRGAALLAWRTRLYYNKKMFADAGIASPPATWDELVADGKKLTNGGKWGLAVEGANPSENIHHAFVFGQQHGGDFFDAAGKPTFTRPADVAAVKQYVDLMAERQDHRPGQRRVRAEPVGHRLRQGQGRDAAVAVRRPPT